MGCREANGVLGGTGGPGGTWESRPLKRSRVGVLIFNNLYDPDYLKAMFAGSV